MSEVITSNATTPETMIDVKWVDCTTCGGACEIEQNGEMIICPTCGGLGGWDTTD